MKGIAGGSLSPAGFVAVHSQPRIRTKTGYGDSGPARRPLSHRNRDDRFVGWRPRHVLKGESGAKRERELYDQRAL